MNTEPCRENKGTGTNIRSPAVDEMGANLFFMFHQNLRAGPYLKDGTVGVVLRCGPQRCLGFFHLLMASSLPDKFNVDSLEGREVPHAQIKVFTGDPLGW